MSRKKLVPVKTDEDINIYDDEQVLWAIATRSQWDKDLMVLPGMMGTTLDPSAEGVSTTKGASMRQNLLIHILFLNDYRSPSLF